MQTETGGPLTQEQVWEIARKHAKDAMAAIADAQMKTWAKWPPPSGPTDFITEAMVRAMEEAGVKYVF
jgi:hypothetical protein